MRLAILLSNFLKFKLFFWNLSYSDTLFFLLFWTLCRSKESELRNKSKKNWDGNLESNIHLKNTKMGDQDDSESEA